MHACTRETNSAIVTVIINGVTIGPCGVVSAATRDRPEIDFVAHDGNGHLHGFTVRTNRGGGFTRDLATLPGATLTPSPAPHPRQPAPAAKAVTDYAGALAAGATRPDWRGGLMRLTVPNAEDAFPDVCAYLINLRVYERTIVNSYHGFDGRVNVPQATFPPTSSGPTHMDWLHLTLASLATWRVTHLVSQEGGPWEVVARLRRALGDSMLGRMLDCPYCLSVWVAAPFAALVTSTPADAFLAWLGLSGAACLLERATTRPPTPAALWQEGEM